MGMKGIVAGAGLLAMTAGVLIAPQASATAPPPKLAVSPAKVAPGQALDFVVSCYGTPETVKSAGLADAVKLTPKGSPDFVGQGRAGTATGRFKASFYCHGSPGLPAASGTATVEFEVVCVPPTTPTTPPSTTKPSEPTTTPTETPSSSAPPSSSAAVVPAALTKPCGTPPGKKPPKQVKVTPKGAPQTGGGAYADRVQPIRHGG